MFRRTVTAVAVALLLVACAKNAKSPLPVDKASDAATVVLNFNAAADLNPGARGQAAPVRIRIFELKNTPSFSRADYFALAERSQSTLGVDLVDQDEVLLQPGQQLTLERPLNEATRQIGLVAGFRDIDHAQWRALLSITQHQTSEFRIGVDARTLHSEAIHSVRPAQ